ncbi:O-methyltransferase [Oceanobacillus luteolus]|uniref:tRNA 5-hydroxyuridine methyltransferase n=1 Tax=Oceanobacillus luteolus TaxID=1274358 RepID=A0ABW4HXE6_9BACI
MINDSIHTYLQELVSPKPDWVMTLEEHADKNNVPIMESVAIDFMLNQIKIHQPKQILEVGTAIGYSALRMLEASPNSEIITIEKDEQRYKEAIETISKQNKDNKIIVHLGDALDVMQKLQEADKKFDFIFIDAAKGKYRDFFDIAHQLLNKGGWIVTDNVLFRGYVANPEAAPKRYKNMVKKISEYNQLLSTHPDYITSILPIGDGVMLSYKID